jgi:HK97 family phage major capsid protein
MSDEIKTESRIDKLTAQTFKREMQFERAEMNKDSRSIELSFSSETPVDRGMYMEVLSHDPVNCDLSRLNNGHPLLMGHNPEEQIGVVEKAWIGEDKKGRAIVRFSKSENGEEIWNDVVDGIRRLVSVGYRIVREVSCAEEAGREVCTFAWQPYEISIVSIPADATVGIGRKQDLESQKTEKENKIMSVEITPTVDYRKESQEILAISKNLAGKVENVRDLADKAIGEGWTADQFRKQALNQLPEIKPIQSNPLADVKARDWDKYSIRKAIGMQMTGRHEGFEAEMHQELSRNSHIKPEGIIVPDAVFARNLIAGTNTLGGFAVQTTNAASEFIEILRNKSQVLNLGARVLNLSGPTTIPRQNGAGTVNWVGETVASTLTAVNFQQLTLTPQAVSAYHQYSKQLLAISDPSVDGIVRDDIAQTLALEIDRVALHGTGSGQPTGIAATSGIGTVLAATDSLLLSSYGATAYPALVSLESAVAAANADQGSLAYLVRPAQRGTLKVLQRFASTDSPIFEDGMINGYRAEATNQIATNLTTGTATTICSAIFFGNWNELLVANFANGTDLVVDPYTAGANGVVRLYARRWVDVGVRHAASFAMLGGIR